MYKHSVTFWTFAVAVTLSAEIKFFHRTLWLMMLYYQTKFGCKHTSSFEIEWKWSCFDYISPCCDLNMKTANQFFLHDTLVDAAALPYQVWYQYDLQFRGYHPHIHSLTKRSMQHKIGATKSQTTNDSNSLQNKNILSSPHVFILSPRSCIYIYLSSVHYPRRSMEVGWTQKGKPLLADKAFFIWMYNRVSDMKLYRKCTNRVCCRRAIFNKNPDFTPADITHMSSHKSPI